MANFVLKSIDNATKEYPQVRNPPIFAFSMTGAYYYHETGSLLKTYF
jgi:hypothetical protein